MGGLILAYPWSGFTHNLYARLLAAVDRAEVLEVVEVEEDAVEAEECVVGDPRE